MALSDFQQIETGMREGHRGSSPTTGGWASTPRITAPTRRKPPARCVWSARRAPQPRQLQRHRRARPATLLREELGGQLGVFHNQLQALQLDPDDYLLMPAHPWQWHNITAIGFAAEIANRQIVYLGLSNDRYRRSSRSAPSSTRASRSGAT